ncbi:hypothetical protein Slin14017_G056940 [Septoria linicola]|nr:hypothetical protein Slin14017_G056940 [Septoria linicola]
MSSIAVQQKRNKSEHATDEAAPDDQHALTKEGIIQDQWWRAEVKQWRRDGRNGQLRQVDRASCAALRVVLAAYPIPPAYAGGQYRLVVRDLLDTAEAAILWSLKGAPSTNLSPAEWTKASIDRWVHFLMHGSDGYQDYNRDLAPVAPGGVTLPKIGSTYTGKLRKDLPCYLRAKSCWGGKEGQKVKVSY